MGLDDPVPKRTQVVFLIAETSELMEGPEIEALNRIINEFVNEINEEYDEENGEQVEIAALTFSSGADWITPKNPLKSKNFIWKPVKASGDANMGAAFKALNEKLSPAFFTDKISYSYFPSVVFLFSCGRPKDDWKKELTALKNNNYFKNLIKVAIAAGDDVNVTKDFLAGFTGDSARIYDLKTLDVSLLMKIINFGLLDERVPADLP
jgi:uncharacterized protein YegL